MVKVTVWLSVTSPGSSQAPETTVPGNPVLSSASVGTCAQANIPKGRYLLHIVKNKNKSLNKQEVRGLQKPFLQWSDLGAGDKVIA